MENAMTISRIACAAPKAAGLLAAFGLMAALAACSGKQNQQRVQFDGHYFPAKAKPVDKKTTWAEFTVEVDRVSQSLDGARAAGEYEGIRYCLTKAKYGSSKIDWAIGPETPVDQLVIDRDTLTFRGTCGKP